MIKRIVAVTVLLMTAADGGEAQMHQHGPAQDSASMPMARGMMMGGMMGHGMMGSGMMDMMDQGMGMMATGGPGPSALLGMRDALELTDEQASTLESMQADLESEMQGRMAAMMSAHQAASDALDDETPDWDAYEGNLRTAADLMVRTHLAMARSALEAREVLTPEQRETLDARGMEMMRGTRKHGMGPGGR